MALVRSLRARVVLWVSVALVVLFAVTGVVLDVAFRNSTDQARRELLEVQVLGLDRARRRLERRALAADRRHRSAVRGRELGPLRRAVLRRRRRRLAIAVAARPRVSRSTISRSPAKSASSGSTCRVSRRSKRCSWASLGSSRTAARADYTFAIALSLEPYNERQAAFRRILIGWFLGITLTMLVVLERLADVRAAAAAAARAASPRGRSRRAREADGALSVGDRRPRRQLEHADRHRAAAPRALSQHARRSRAQLEDAARRDAHAARRVNARARRSRRTRR